MDKLLSGGEPVFLMVLHAEPSIEDGEPISAGNLPDDFLLNGELGKLDIHAFTDGVKVASGLERAVAAQKHAYAAVSPLRLYTYIRAEVNEDDVEDVQFSRAIVTARNEREAEDLGYRALNPVPHGYVSSSYVVDIDEAIRAVDVQPDQQYNVIAIPRH
jgi:hypothetical protein